MTQEQHPITPPPELVQRWLSEGHHQDYCSAAEHAIAQAARWGSDQELEACCKWLDNEIGAVDPCDLRAARRPKPLSLKEQALADLASMELPPCVIDGVNVNAPLQAKYQNIRRALAQLPDD